MIHRRIRDQPLEVRLCIGSEGAKDNRSSCKESQRARKDLRLHRIQWQDETQESICTELEQNASQDHRASGRRFSVRIRKPGVEGPNWNLDCKRNRKCPECNRLDRLNRHAQERSEEHTSELQSRGQ